MAGLSIDKNYSVLNNYNYEEKSTYSSTLDFLSTPCRRVLGGASICLLSETYDTEMSTRMKIITLAFSVIIFPVAIVSIVSLVAKLFTCPWSWEPQMLKEQSEKTWNFIHGFNEAFDKAEYDKAIEIFRKNPAIIRRETEYSNFFTIINRKLNQGASWEEVQNLLAYLHPDHAHKLINYAVKQRFSSETNSDCYLTAPSDVDCLVRNSLRFSDIKSLETCYSEVLSGPLQITRSDNPLVAARKMEISDYLINTFVQIKVSQTQNEFKSTTATLTDYNFRSKPFENVIDQCNYSLIFRDKNCMQKVSNALQTIRKIDKIGSYVLNKLEESDENQGQAIRFQFQTFKNGLNEIPSSQINEGEKIFIATVQEIVDQMIELIDQVPNISEEQAQQMNCDFEKQIENCRNLLTGGEVSRSQTDLENLLAVLSLKKKASLIDYTEKLKEWLKSVSALKNAS